MNKKLFVEAPLITSFPTHANSISVANRFPDSFQWFYENYVQLCARPRRIPPVINSYVNFYAPYPWRSCPWFKFSDIPRAIVNMGWQSIQEFIIDAIQNEYYVLMYLDYYYLSVASQYLQTHFGHDTFIYGYDDKLKCFYSADFFGEKYQHKVLDFNEVNGAYNSMQYSTLICDDFDGVVIFKLQECNYFNFDAARYKRNVDNFLNSSIGEVQPSFGYKAHNFQCPEEYIYGLRVFEFLINYLKIVIEEKIMPVDIRGFHTIYDHAVITGKTIDFLIYKGCLENGEQIKTEVMELQKKALLARNKIIMANLTQNYDIIKDSIRIIRNIYALEHNAFTSIQKSLIM